MTLSPDPPVPFLPDEEVLRAGAGLYRVHSNTRRVTAFNPGVGSPTRFGFFGTPPVPILYAAATEQAAVAETLLHDVPVTGGLLPYAAYADKVMGRILLERPVRLAKLRGLGLRKLGIKAADVTDTTPAAYPHTVMWAHAAHEAGYDGMVWTSRKCDDAAAVVLFGDRCVDAVRQDATFARLFQTGPGLEWLIAVCTPLHVDVLPPR